MHRPTTALAILILISTTSVSAANNKPQRKAAPQNIGDTAADLVYTPLNPCRIIDTRIGGGFMTGGSTRSFKVAGTTGFDLQGGTVGGCGVPIGATSVLINFVAVSPDGVGNLKGAAYPDAIPTTGSIINYQLLNPVLNIANAVTFPICDPAVVNPCAADITIFTNVGGTHLVADVLGYFKRFPTEQTITAIVPGTGLAGGGTAGPVTLEIDTSTASAGQALRYNGSSIDWVSLLTSITAGTGLTGGGTSGDVSLEVQFAGSGSATTAARSDHSHYLRTIIVSPGVTPQAGGTALQNAIAGITTASDTDHYLIKIEPGIYDLGTTQLVMKQYVDVEGSGDGVTIIRNSSPTDSGVLLASAAVRSLTIEGAYSAVMAVGVSTVLEHVTIRSTAPGNSFGLYYRGESGTQTLNDVTIISTGFGALPFSISTETSLTTPIYAALHHVTLIANAGGGNGTAVQNAGGSIDGENVRIRLTNSGSGQTIGLFSLPDSSIAPSIVLRSFRIDQTCGNEGPCVAVAQYSSNASRYSEGTITVGGSGTSYGVFNNNSSTRLFGVSVEVTGAIGAFGVGNDAGSSNKVEIENSRISAATNTVITTGAGYTTRISNTRLEGGPVATGSSVTRCTYITDELMATFNNTCP